MFDNGGIAGKLAQIHALAADVAVLISSDTSGPAAYEGLVEAIPAVAQVDLVLCLLAERADRTGQFAFDNAVSMASWLRKAAHSSPRWASERVNAGRAVVDSLPRTRAGWDRGELTLEHVTVIRLVVDGLDEHLTARLDEALAAAAVYASPKDLRDVAAVLLEELVPDRQEKDRERKAGFGQKAHLSDTPDGGRLDADLDAEGTALVRAALDKFLPKPEPGVLLSQRRAVALVEMARQALDFGAGHEGSANKPHLVVTISADQLRDQLGVGYLPAGGTLPVGTLRRLACDAKIIPLLYGADGLPLDVGRSTRTIPPAMKIALNFRDQGCAAPGCDRPPSWCDGHHVRSWLDGGITALINLMLLCRRHHTMVHQGKLRIHALGNQKFVFTNTTEQLPVTQPTT
jgi:Domain of unknown function (DUF222)